MFFKDIDDLKKVITVNKSFSFSEIDIYLQDVDRLVLKRYLGKTFLAAVQTVFNDASAFKDVPAPHKELIDYLRVASANLALVKWIPSGQVSIDSSGIRINTSENLKTAFPWQIKNLERAVTERGYNALEDALEYLEDNIANAAFETYKASDEFKENNYLFVPSSREFAKHCSLLQTSRINYHKIRSVIKKVEDFEVKAVLLPDFFAEIKTTLQSGEPLGELAQTIVDMLKPAIVNLSVHRAIGELAVTLNADGLLVFDNKSANETTGYEQAPTAALSRIGQAALFDGNNYLKAAADYLEANKDDYPTFKNDAQYIDPEEDETDINDGEQPFFYGG